MSLIGFAYCSVSGTNGYWIFARMASPAHQKPDCTRIAFIPGVADPPAFARQWAAALPNVPHTFLPDDGKPTQRGELRSIRFQVSLWLPASWPMPPALHAQSAKCAE
jgi:hypothetical protein